MQVQIIESKQMIYDTLAVLEANAGWNAEAFRNQFRVKESAPPNYKEVIAQINGRKVSAYAIFNSSHKRFNRWWSVRWYLDGKVVSRANLIKTLEVAA